MTREEYWRMRYEKALDDLHANITMGTEIASERQRIAKKAAVLADAQTEEWAKRFEIVSELSFIPDPSTGTRLEPIRDPFMNTNIKEPTT